MEQVKLLRRRTTDLLANAQQNITSTQQSFLSSAQQNIAQAQQNLPALSMPHFGSLRFGQSSPASAAGTTEPKATWECIDDIPALRRSAHSLDIVGGSAYIFGGEIGPSSGGGEGGEGGGASQLADNDMHVVRLPVSGASTDYLRIKAVPEKPYDEDAEATASSSDGAGSEAGSNSSISSPRGKGKGKERAIDIARPDLGDVPGPRAGHATAVIGSRIFLFGGHSGGHAGSNLQPLEEAGRVWVFDTRTRAWSHLDPAPAVKGGAITIHPAARSHHCAAAIDKPREFGTPTADASTTTSSATSTPTPAPPPTSPTTLRARAMSWRDWAVGDLAGPQEPAVGHVAESAVDEESRGYGTLFVHAGRLAGDRGNDLWAFDVRSRMWSELPSAPGPARDGAAICVSKSRLFRFGGCTSASSASSSSGGAEGGRLLLLGGQLDYLPLEVETTDDRRQRAGRAARSGGGARIEVAVRARDGWQTIVQHPTSTYSSTVTPSAPLASPRLRSSTPELAPAVGVGVGVGGSPGAQHEWPSPRSGATLEAVTMGGGREALVLAFGEGEPSGRFFLDDVWLFQPPTSSVAGGVTAAVMQAVVGRKTGEGRWARVAVRPHDGGEDEHHFFEDGQRPAPLLLPRARGLLAGAPMNNLEDSGLLVWGGLREDGARLGDGWVLRL
ncbi:Kelch repeat type 1 [Cordyceps javanica]|uniref:Kelch repeat type 1 n=1 Tax=Cordyceps javanica TaxID=43265 RepID=A0A545UZS9_9HYPO|nr:Kelch repeat type 1 [Cordyceps javanica]TQW05810.1 Kelch repeat type 1 [Cordyceps javanica]